MSIDITYHYPPELLNLLINTIPRLNRSKQDIFLFFKGAGVAERLMSEPLRQWQYDKDSINKFDIVRQILAKINEEGEKCLRERREILKRVVEFDNFSVCWENDRLEAKGLVAEIQKVVDVKDSFTRMNIEREKERKKRLEKEHAEKVAIERKRTDIEKVRQDLSKLFSEKDTQKRGKALEMVLNNLFKVYGISIRKAFTLIGDSGEGVIEQIDGAIELDGHVYLVEMKWWKKPLGVSEISEHLVRVYQRAEGRAIIISASEYTEPSIRTCKDALVQKVVVLCTLQEIVMLLEREGDLKDFFRKKTQAAIADKNPFLSKRDI